MTSQERQAKRLAKFPADRLPLCKDHDTVTADKNALKAYFLKNRDFEWLREQIARNNYLKVEDVTDVRLRRLLKETGWERDELCKVR